MTNIQNFLFVVPPEAIFLRSKSALPNRTDLIAHLGRQYNQYHSHSTSLNSSVEQPHTGRIIVAERKHKILLLATGKPNLALHKSPGVEVFL